jgi:hypothetical protein
MIFDDGRRKNVPGVLGKNVGDKKINVLRAVWEFDPVRGVYAVVRPLPGLGPHRFDLDAPEHLSDADDKVVTFTICPRFGNSESATGSFAHKSKLGEFAAMFIVQVCIRRFVSFFGDAQCSTPITAKIWPNNTKSAAIAALFILSDCYIKNSMPEGVIAPSFEIYIRAGIRDLVKNQVSRGLDKNFAQVSAITPLGPSASLGISAAGSNTP